MELASLLRPAGLVAGPAAVVSLALFVTGMLTVGEDRLDASVLATASSGALLVALLGIGAGAVAALARLRAARGGVTGPAIATVGSVLVAGGVWAALFVVSTLAVAAPQVLQQELTGVTVGYIASYVVFTVGWVWTAIALLRARLVPVWLGVLLAVAGAVAFVPAPEPARILLIGVAGTLLARRLAVVPESADDRLPQPA